MPRTWTPAQQNAIDTRGCTLLVSAAAGSGKTATLTERIIRRLTDPEHPAELSRMLIVTFTRAAAAELRERISAALSEAIAHDPGNRHLQRQLIGLGSAHISTIDAFCFEPVKAHFAESGLPASFRIADEAELTALSEQILGDMMDEYYLKYACETQDGEKNPFSLLEGNLFADLCDSLTPSGGDGSILATLKDLYDKLLTYPEGLNLLRTQADRMEAEADRDFLLTDHGRVILTYLRELVVSSEAFYRDALALIETDEKAVKYYMPTFAYESAFIQTLSVLMQDDSGNTPCYAAIREHLLSFMPPRCGTYRDCPDEFVPMKSWRTALVADIRKVRNTYFVDTPEQLDEHRNKTARLCRVLADFLNAYDRRMAEEKRNRAICDFTDNRRNLLKMLRDADGRPSAMALEYRERYDEVYIDEYQDVDEVQDTIFALIGGDHRFMVGDIKQSIYGFRGSEPSVFARYRRDLSPLNEDAPSPMGHSIFMSENFRCDEPIIRVTNAISAHVFSACPDTVGYAPDDDLRYGKGAVGLAPEGYVAPPVEVLMLNEGGGDKNHPASEGAFLSPRSEVTGEEDEDMSGARAEAVWVANRIADLLRSGATLSNGKPITPGDIAILSRAGACFGEFTAALTTMGIPTGCEELETEAAKRDILHGSDMMYLVNLLRIIDNPDTDIPLAEVLRAPFPGLTLEEVIILRESGEPTREPLYAVLEHYCDATDRVDLALQAKLTAFRHWLESYRALVPTQSADAILRRLRRDERCAARNSRAFLYLYDTARTCKQASFMGLYTFLRFFEKKLVTAKRAPADEGTDIPGGTVSLMTIHSSKGLEFPVCFVVRCGQPFSANSRKGDLLFHKETGIALKLYEREMSAKRNTVLRAATALAIRQDEREEEMRLLYVAMTRARERLILVGVNKGGAADTVFFPADRYAALSCNKYLSWIAAGLTAHPDVTDCVTVGEVCASKLYPNEPLPPRPSIHTAPENNSLVDRYAAILAAHTQPNRLEEMVRVVPTKVPASRLTEHLLDTCVFYMTDAASGEVVEGENEIKLPADERGLPVFDARTRDSIRRQVEMMSSSTAARDELEILLGVNHRPTAAERGTAVHLFLQYCDYRLVAAHGVEEEIARLTELGFISPHVAEILDRGQLKDFFASAFFARLCTAEQIERELRFTRFVPLATLTTDPAFAQALGDRTLYVQGSIDLVATYPDGTIELCDYKTDHISSAERRDPTLLQKRLSATHASQLAQYACAVEDMYHKRPDAMYIYSLPLGEALKM